MSYNWCSVYLKWIDVCVKISIPQLLLSFVLNWKISKSLQNERDQRSKEIFLRNRIQWGSEIRGRPDLSGQGLEFQIPGPFANQLLFAIWNPDMYEFQIPTVLQKNFHWKRTSHWNVFFSKFCLVQQKQPITLAKLDYPLKSTWVI